MQETRVLPLVWEDPTCSRATKPVSHSHWAWALEPGNCKYWAPPPQLPRPAHPEPRSTARGATAVRSSCAATREDTPLSAPREKPAQQHRPSAVKTKWATVLNRFIHVRPVDRSPPASSVPGVLQAITLEWVAMPSSRGSSPRRVWICISSISCIAGSFLTTEPPGKPRGSATKNSIN